MLKHAAAWIGYYCYCGSPAQEYGHVPLVPTTDWLVGKVCASDCQTEIAPELRHVAIIEKLTCDIFRNLSQPNDDPAKIATDPSFFEHMAMYRASLSPLTPLSHSLTASQPAQLDCG